MPILGTPEHSPAPDKGTNQLAQNRPPVPLGAGSANHPEEALKLSAEERLLAAVAYGEGSTKNVFEEMAGIAAVIVRQAKAHDQTVSQFLQSDAAKKFTFVLVDGNARYGLLMKAPEDAIGKNLGMLSAVKAARHTLSGGRDYSDGAYFWDGADIKQKAKNHTHEKVNHGIHFTNPTHNIYGIKESEVPGEGYYKYPDNKPPKLRGKWKYRYESTAAIGGTIFWKLNSDFIKGSGNKEYE